MKTQRTMQRICGFALTLLFAAVWAAVASAADAERISKEQLKELLGNPEVTILDVRPERDWKISVLKIKGASWEDFEEVEKWAPKYPRNARLVLYCA